MRTAPVKRDHEQWPVLLPAARLLSASAAPALHLWSMNGWGPECLANEGKFRGRFPECETSAMPPFGNLYDMAVYAGEMLTQDREIAFNAGTHNELVRLGYDDFARLAQPRVARFAAAAGRMTAQAYDG